MLPDEPRHYFAQMQAYQITPDEEMFTIQEVVLNTSVDEIVSRPGVHVNCSVCGEESINERELVQDGLPLYHACAGKGYYQTAISYEADLSALSLSYQER